ncbi:50S ribosomal protein L11 [bacterium CG_4_10_14_0_2_um_filter_33_32]|nr:MAG: 50S ribosomal protein L11 [bacterium CG2_30_33_46]PIU76573.1 MAG: 50S ribosomal protein L11 [bacterium CG06_land_8_20_14_3_00_33_50]PIY85588.1 MAG: 50S ribosomal protein L11 [bacterium CG_4_10_14_0_8_um_filter_33_57]PIZ86693.1 MAG: 50S ribosomal protein L11 [bacterium CG_4_10_14_0_2_um_filter_33_32]PJA72026.1 MAG: 50S ribosomal protein L11 [bacterium CG_4_9_14_3_um_filter_33_26]
MAKQVKTKIKLQIRGGQATPAPPVGSSLGQHGVNIIEFTTQFNEHTKDKMGQLIPVVITIYEDRTFDFVLKTTPAAELLKKAAGVEKGSGVPYKDKKGKVTKEQIREIAEIKMQDLNANSTEQAEKIIAGTARSMGIEVEK